MVTLSPGTVWLDESEATRQKLSDVIVSDPDGDSVFTYSISPESPSVPFELSGA